MRYKTTVKALKGEHSIIFLLSTTNQGLANIDHGDLLECNIQDDKIIIRLIKLRQNSLSKNNLGEIFDEGI